MKSIEEIFASNVRARLSALGMSQRELAAKIGITENSLSRTLSGLRPSRRSNQEAIATALGCSREELIQDPENPYVQLFKIHQEQLAHMASELQKMRDKDRANKDQINIIPELVNLLASAGQKKQLQILDYVKAALLIDEKGRRKMNKA